MTKKKKLKKKKRVKNKNKIVIKNFFQQAAMKHSGSGIHKDKRTKRIKKEIDWDHDGRI